MGATTFTVERTIAASPLDCFREAQGIDTWAARLRPDVLEVLPVERGPDHTVSRWTTRAAGRRFRYLQRDDYRPEVPMVLFRQLEGDLRRFEGTWRWEATADGCTRSILTVTVETAFPVSLKPLLDPVALATIRKAARALNDGLAARVEATRRGGAA
jgi:coenzyme Q-binding protein COQ10